MGVSVRTGDKTMNRKNTLLILIISVALVGTGILLISDSVSLRAGRHGYVYSQTSIPTYMMRGCPEPHLPECGLVVW